MEERNLRLTREKADLASSLTELEEELAEVLCFIIHNTNIYFGYLLYSTLVLCSAPSVP